MKLKTEEKPKIHACVVDYACIINENKEIILGKINTCLRKKNIKKQLNVCGPSMKNLSALQI